MTKCVFETDEVHRRGNGFCWSLIEIGQNIKDVCNTSPLMYVNCLHECAYMYCI